MNRNLDILCCDDSYLVVDKPADLLTVPGRGPGKMDCLVSRIRALFPDLPPQPAVHRLDQQTSGLLVLARTGAAHKELSRQFRHRLVDKRYTAVVDGFPPADSGVIELAFRLDPDNRPYQVYDPINGRYGVTLWRKRADEPRGSRLEFTPLTGRTHQLRLHAAHPLGLGTPIAGDRLYGDAARADRLLLHASYLRFNHPVSGEIMEYRSDAPF